MTDRDIETLADAIVEVEDSARLVRMWRDQQLKSPTPITPRENGLQEAVEHYLAARARLDWLVAVARPPERATKAVVEAKAEQVTETLSSAAQA